MSNEDRNPVDDYVRVAGEVVKNIGVKASTTGDPQHYGATYSALANAYLHSVSGTRPLGQADVHVLDILRGVALMVSGGVQPQWFRDIAAAAITGSVHVEAAIAAVQAARAAEKPRETSGGPVAAPDAPQAPMPAAADPFAELDTPIEPIRVTEPEHQDDYVRPDDLDSLYHPDPEDKPVPVANDKDLTADEERASDADLLRWVLDPGSDPWADLLEEGSGDPNSEYRCRPGVDHNDVQARFDRLHAILDGRRPDNVTPTQWAEAQRRALPVLYGDVGAA